MQMKRFHWPREFNKKWTISLLLSINISLLCIVYTLSFPGNAVPTGEYEALVTIIVPSKLRPTLVRTIDSLQRQHDSRWKALVVAQLTGSTASVKHYQALKSQFQADGRIKFLRYPGTHAFGNCASKLRMYGAWRVGTKYVGFVDDDDVLDERYVTILSTYLEQQAEVDLVTFRAAFPQGFVTPPVQIKDVEISQIGISFALNATKLLYTPFRDTGCEDFDFLNRFCHFKGRCAFLGHIGYRVKAVPIEYKREQGMNFLQVPPAEHPHQLLAHQKTYLDFLKDCKYPIGKSVLAKFALPDHDAVPSTSWIKASIRKAIENGCYLGQECTSITFSIGSRCKTACCVEIMLSYTSLVDIYHNGNYDYLLFQSLPLLPSTADKGFTWNPGFSKRLPRVLGPSCDLRPAQEIPGYPTKTIDVFILGRECSRFMYSLCNYLSAIGLHVQCQVPILSQNYEDVLSRSRIVVADPSNMDKEYEMALRLAVHKGKTIYSISGINLPFEYYYDGYVLFTSQSLLPRLIVSSAYDPLGTQHVSPKVQEKVQMEAICQSLRHVP